MPIHFTGYMSVRLLSTQEKVHGKLLTVVVPYMDVYIHIYVCVLIKSDFLNVAVTSDKILNF